MTERTDDPFYSESNMAHLMRGVEALNAGKGVEYEIIPVTDAILPDEAESLAAARQDKMRGGVLPHEEVWA